MILIVAALALFAQDPPAGDVIVTAPRRPAAATMPDPYGAPAEVAPRPTLSFDVTGYAAEVAARQRARAESAAGSGYPTEGGYSRSASAAASAPLPPEALSDPVRYAAQQCRPETRPVGEDVATCFDRIDRRVRAEQDRRDASRRPQMRCENSQTRDDDGRTSSTSGRCTVGTGDPALLDDILGW